MKVITIVLGILTLIGGIVALFTPSANFLAIGWLLGLVLLIVGIEAVIIYFAYRKKRFVSSAELILGVVAAVMGVLLLINQNMQFFAEAIFVYVFAVWLLIGGVTRVVLSIERRDGILKKSGFWVWTLIAGVLELGLGIYAFIHPMFSAVAIGWLMALFIIMIGIDMIAFGTTMMSKKKLN